MDNDEYQKKTYEVTGPLADGGFMQDLDKHELMILADDYAHKFAFVGDDEMPKARNALAQAIIGQLDKIARLEAECAALRADAERFRFIEKVLVPLSAIGLGPSGLYQHFDEYGDVLAANPDLRVMIDAGIAAMQAGGKP